MLIGEAKQIGKRKYVVLGQGKDVFEAITDYQQAGFYDMHKCGICGSENLILRSRLAGEKKYKYSEVRCLDCKGQLVITQNQETNSYYYRKSKADNTKLDWKAFTPNPS